jgi:hypothetical protein
LREKNLPHKIEKICRLTNKMYLHTVATFSGVLIGNDIEHAAVSAYLLIKNGYYFVSNPSNYTVKSNFLFRHGPFAFPGKGGGGRWVA